MNQGIVNIQVVGKIEGIKILLLAAPDYGSWAE
jgi:hypothetical protein